jgi:hypothetical protein
VPYRSEKQRRFMHAKHPDIAKRWDKETGGKIVPSKKSSTKSSAEEEGLEVNLHPAAQYALTRSASFPEGCPQSAFRVANREQVLVAIATVLLNRCRSRAG